MDYVNFGSAGLQVSRIALGLGLRGQADERAVERLIRAAFDRGINLFDCANVYGLMDDRAYAGRSEEILGRALRGRRDEVVITSKVVSPIGPGPNDRGASRYHILREVERSLRRLGTDHIDVYLLHQFVASTPLASVPLMLAGAAVGVPGLRRLLPEGTLAARRGLPATILLRGLLTFTFFGADAYVTLTITAVRHRSPVVAGIAVTGATLACTAGAWIQARLSESWEGRRLVRAGLVIVLAGIAGMVLVLQPAVPVAVGLAAWTVAGLGMGLGYAPISLMMLRMAPPGREGRASASLNLADVLGTAIGIGVGGAAVAVAAGRELRLGIAAAFAVTAAMGVIALVLTRRLPPGTTSSPPPVTDRVPASAPD